VYIPLERSLQERLALLARRERRRPQDQAVLIIERALRRAYPQHGGRSGTRLRDVSQPEDIDVRPD
jgi:hypothetical protein